uniref:Uncharacterized protein n=1 Tax=Arundo donax TaxID=35708 RepID=A0A0A9HJM1_ARUDO
MATSSEQTGGNRILWIIYSIRFISPSKVTLSLRVPRP